MNTTEQTNSATTLTASLQKPKRLPLFLLAATLLGFWASVIFQISAQWAVYEQYAYGWAVPFLCAYLVWRSRTEPLGFRGSPSSIRHLPSSAQALSQALIVLSALLFFPTWVVVEANPIWRAASYLITLEVITITLGMLYLIGGGAWLRRFAFPICFFLVSIPWPSALENLVIQSLTRFNTAAAVEIMSVLGIPVLQHGNVIEISAGMVGVDEACSGVRSIQTTLMMTLFFGALYRLNWRRRGWLIAAGMGLALICNLCRTSFLVWIASRDGIKAIDRWHDPAGVAILVACFTGIWLVSEWFAKAKKLHTRPARNEWGEGRGEGQPKLEVESQDCEEPPLPTFGHPLLHSKWRRGTGRGGVPVHGKGEGQAQRESTLSSQPTTLNFSPLSTPIAFNSILVSALLLWLAGTLVAGEAWFRFHEHKARALADWSVKWPEDRRDFREIPISANALSQLKCNESHNYSWRESDGTAWQAFYLRWLPAGNLINRANIHLAKTHRPEHCLTAAGKALKQESAPQVFTQGELNLPYRSLVFDDRGRNLHVFFVAWEDDTPAGAYANMRDNSASRLAAAWAGNRGKGQRVMEVAIWGLPDLKSAEAAFHKFMTEAIETVER